MEGDGGIMIRKILNLTVLVVLVFFAGTACKKDSAQPGDTKSYLVDPNDATKPGPSKPTDTCLQKGAVGVQALLTKADCTKLNTPKCGDGKPEGNEGCDDGPKNGLAGSICTIDCKKITDKKEGGTSGGNTTTKVLKITTTSMPDKSLGDKYSATIKALGGKNSKDYKWTVSNLPEGFEYKDNNDSVTISSKAALTKTGTYKPSVQVCLLSSPADCVTCSENVCSFLIKDGVTLTAHRSTSSKAICPSSTGGSCTLTVAPTESISGFVNADGPKFLLILYVDSYFTTDKNFQWKLSVKDGSSVKEIPVVKASEQLQCNPLMNSKQDLSAACNGKTVSFPSGLFLMEPKHGDDKVGDVGENAGKGTYHKHYLMFGSDAYGKTYEGVEVFVKNNSTGGEQKIIFDKITLPTLTNFNLEKDKKNPCYGKTNISIPKMLAKIGGSETEIKGKVNEWSTNVVNFDVEGSLGDSLNATMKVIGSLAPYTINFTNFGASIHVEGSETSWAVLHEEGSDWKVEESAENTLQLTGDFKYDYKYGKPEGGKTSDQIRFNVSDQCGHSNEVWVNFTVKTPELKISDIKRMRVMFCDEYTDKDNKMRIQLMEGDTVIAQTDEFGIDGDDPTCFGDSTIRDQYDDDFSPDADELKDPIWQTIKETSTDYTNYPVSKIDKVRISMTGDSGASMFYSVYNLYLVTDDFYMGWGSKKGKNGSVSGASKNEDFSYPTDFKDSKGQVWHKRVNPGNPNKI
jgi:hypothetical protein